FREPVRRTLRWLLSLRDARGRIVCPEHKLEHTGKSAGAAVMAAILGELDDDDTLRAAALQQGERMVANLVREGTSPCHTFRPGRHDPFNCSNSVIDGGACSDALAELVHRLGSRMDGEQRQRFRDASLLHARTYLRYAVLDKGIPAQRAWGLSGLANAWTLERDETLERAALEAVGVLEGIQNADGSYPYHPLEWGGAHAGSGDVSAFYQSRVTGFLLFALERLGRDPRDGLFAGPLERGLDFLLALQGPDGIKAGLVEAKPWYWGATYEVASNVFDVYAFAAGWRAFRRRPLADAALRAFRAWSEHLEPDGRPRSHLAGHGRTKSYQCPVFWAAHAEWIARSFELLEQAAASAPGLARTVGQGIDLRVGWFPNAELGRLEDDAVVAWVRGSRPGFNVHHGSPHGAGLIRVLRKSDGAELVTRCRLGGSQEAEWNGKVGSPAPLRGWRANKDELRFSLWLARNHWRGERYGAALRAPFAVAARGLAAYAAPRVSSAFFLAPTARAFGDSIVLKSGIAWRDGRPVPGVELERTFQLDGNGLSVRERRLRAPAGLDLAYAVPRAARDVERESDEVRYRLA
ncbi:MAG: hypothetical protein IT453_08900, partial [Planctomycetes bacterium]|nr:hypothetical protein [Planctomycetota bacterium]